MATDALAAFLQRDFPRADQALLSLTSDNSTELHNVKKLTDDPRIKHNALVASFYSQSTPENLQNVIFFVSEFLPPEQRPTSAHDFFTRTTADADALKFLYTHVGPVSLYNVAVIAYHEGYVQPAAAVGELLYVNVEAMDDWLALKTCFLLIDVHLRLSDVSSATTVATYAEKLLPNFAKSAAEGAAVSEMKTLSPDWSGRQQGILEVPASYEDAKFCMHIYNARLSATGDASPDGARGIRKEAKNAVFAADDTETRPTAAALLIKARVEQNYSKGLRILASIVTQSPPHIITKVRPLVLNSLGVFHHRLGRHALAACYFEHARQAFNRLFKNEADSHDKTVNLTQLSSAKDSQVSFNLALQYMKLGDYSRALDLFTICVRSDMTYANESALLWLRMAECCVGIESSTNGRQSLATEGQGRGRRLIMRSDGRSDGLTMEYAATCAKAAIAILDRQKGFMSDYQNSSTNKAKRFSLLSNSSTRLGRTDPGASAVTPSPDEYMRIRAAALTTIAYASLAFDPKAVIEACDELHKLYPKSDNDRCLLGRLYAAEAYCMLGRPDEAATRLAPLLAANVSADPSVREAAYINMALTHASNGDVASASSAAKVALKTFGPNHKRNRVLRKEAIFAASYIFLRSGEVETARRCLRSLLNPSE